MFAVTPLTCDVPATVTLAPLVAKVGIRAETSVPNGTVAVIDVPLMLATTSAARPEFTDDSNVNAVMSFAEFSAAVTVTV